MIRFSLLAIPAILILSSCGTDDGANKAIITQLKIPDPSPGPIIPPGPTGSTGSTGSTGHSGHTMHPPFGVSIRDGAGNTSYIDSTAIDLSDLSTLRSAPKAIGQREGGPSGLLDSTKSRPRVSFKSLLPLLSEIDTASLSGNNRSFVNYLNQNAPSAASKFLSASAEGTLKTAVEQASPLRNAASIFGSNNTFFSIAQGVSNRARDARQLRRAEEKNNMALALLSSREGSIAEVTDDPTKPKLKNLWIETLGLLAKKKSQDNTPGFDPWSVGALAGYDAQKTKNFRKGFGLGYAYTAINFENGNGKSLVNQEFLSLYGLFHQKNLYANFALWGGLFQTNHLRNIHLSSNHFQAKAFTSGYQFDPHLELGLSYPFNNHTCTFEPFGSLDWNHNWQFPYKEHGSPLNFIQQRLHSSMLRAEVGVKLAEEFSCSLWNIILQQSLSYIHKDTYSVGAWKGFLVGAPGTLSLNTFTQPEDMGALALAVLINPIKGSYPTGKIGYKGELGSTYRSHQVSISSEWGF